MFQPFVSLGFYDMVDYLGSYQRIFGEYLLNTYGSFSDERMDSNATFILLSLYLIIRAFEKRFQDSRGLITYDFDFT